MGRLAALPVEEAAEQLCRMSGCNAWQKHGPTPDIYKGVAIPPKYFIASYSCSIPNNPTSDRFKAPEPQSICTAGASQLQKFATMDVMHVVLISSDERRIGVDPLIARQSQLIADALADLVPEARVGIPGALEVANPPIQSRFSMSTKKLSER
jgi:hypothetical protein